MSDKSSPEFTIYSDQGQSDPFIKLLMSNFEQMGFDVSRKPATWQNWKKAAKYQNLCLFCDKPAPWSGALSAYRVLNSSHWILDTAEKAEDTQMAKAAFLPSGEDKKSNQILAKLRGRYADTPKHEYAMQDFVLIILDDALNRVGPRAFSSFRMIDDVLKFTQARDILIHVDFADLPPNQADKLKKYESDERVSFTKSQLDRLMPACAFVVVQEGGHTLRAALHGKPSITYGQEPFHHLFRNPIKDGRAKKCFNRMERDRPDYAGYMNWIFQNSFDAKSDDAPKKLIERLQELNWQSK